MGNCRRSSVEDDGQIHSTKHRLNDEGDDGLREEPFQTYEQRGVRKDDGECLKACQCKVGHERVSVE